MRKCVVLLFVIVLFSSCFVSVFGGGSFFVSGVSGIVVSNETELRNAINNAVGSTTIAIDKDITLTETLKIPDNKNVTLTSNKPSGYYKLNGVFDMSTISVLNGGVLVLDGVIVTHTGNAGDRAGGVGVSGGGMLILYSGEISGNTVVGWVNPHQSGGYGDALGGGLYNYGVFEMYGGKISGNNVRGHGGGVFNSGVFKMFGGEISGNVVNGEVASGGGVFNAYQSSFVMSGGVISGNTAGRGGGVYNLGSFNMSGGEIVGNKGGVVTSGYGVFDKNGCCRLIV
ncbi:MAG: hypothetical protein LBB87_00470 [Nitrososphaerota archaeon]|jgi:hypothetical protein|nr:hypothetical protein [Nitrososphaerota archaeon]